MVILITSTRPDGRGIPAGSASTSPPPTRRWTLLAAAAFTFVVAGCNEIVGILEGSPRAAAPCAVDADCPLSASPTCAIHACEEARCVYHNAPSGAASSHQIDGDCTQIVCDGHGGEKSIPLLTDVQDDNDPCTLDACDGVTPTHSPASEVPCYQGPPLTKGKGQCIAGIQSCDALGEPIGGCEGAIVPDDEACDADMVDEDCDDQVNEEGAGCACHPGDIEPCYDGPAGTEGIGECRGGKHACAPDGRGYGPCVGEKTQAAETCDAEGRDEDCDGEHNEQGADCFCGDLFVSPGNGEECDDGNVDPTDACTTACKPAACGDGFTQPGLGELCDDGNLDSSDSCNSLCQPSGCGDGFLQSGESCDDGNVDDGDGCPATCVQPVVELATRYDHVCARFSDGRIKCWGRNTYGQLGLGDTVTRGNDAGEMGPALPAVNLGQGAAVISIAAGYDHTCAVLSDGRVKCWGKNNYGQLGLGDAASRGTTPATMGDALPAVDLGPGKKAIAATAGFSYSCALLDDASVKCWGQGSLGQLGIGDGNTRGAQAGQMGASLPPVDLGTNKHATAISSGTEHSCALLDDATVKCWGYNGYGQLGLGDIMNRGAFPGQMGDALPTVNLGSGSDVASLSAGHASTCSVLTSGGVKCWGVGGALGLGDPNSRGAGFAPMGDALPELDLGSNRTALMTRGGAGSHCAVLDDATLKCWGANDYGKLGLGDTSKRGDDPMEMGDLLPTVNLGAGVAGAQAVATGELYACALSLAGDVKCWGANFWGQLGVGDVQARGGSPGEMGDALPAVQLW